MFTLVTFYDMMVACLVLTGVLSVIHQHNPLDSKTCMALCMQETTVAAHCGRTGDLTTGETGSHEAEMMFMTGVATVKVVISHDRISEAQNPLVQQYSAAGAEPYDMALVDGDTGYVGRRPRAVAVAEAKLLSLPSPFPIAMRSATQNKAKGVVQTGTQTTAFWINQKLLADAAIMLELITALTNLHVVLGDTVSAQVLSARLTADNATLRTSVATFLAKVTAASTAPVLEHGATTTGKFSLAAGQSGIIATQKALAVGHAPSDDPTSV